MSPKAHLRNDPFMKVVSVMRWVASRNLSCDEAELTDGVILWRLASGRQVASNTDVRMACAAALAGSLRTGWIATAGMPSPLCFLSATKFTKSPPQSMLRSIAPHAGHKPVHWTRIDTHTLLNDLGSVTSRAKIDLR